MSALLGLGNSAAKGADQNRADALREKVAAMAETNMALATDKAAALSAATEEKRAALDTAHEEHTAMMHTAEQAHSAALELERTARTLRRRPAPRARLPAAR